LFACASLSLTDDAVSAPGVRNALVAFVGLLLTFMIAVTPRVDFAYQAPISRSVLETAVSLVATLLALLCVGRYRRYVRPGDLAVVCAMALLAIAYPFLGALPRAVLPSGGQRIGAWAPLAAQVVAAAALAVATGPRFQRPGRPGVRRRTLVAGLIVGAAIVLFVWLAPHGPVGPVRLDLAETARPLADPLVAGIQFGSGVLFAVAAARFSVLAERRHDPFLGWLGAGCVLAAVASLNYTLFPSVHPSWLFTGDLFRAAAMTAWAFGAVGEIVSYWSEIGRLARAVERRRLARDLHDGLAQELAFLVSHTQAPKGERLEAQWLEQLAAAAQRALAESRRAIAALVAEASLPLESDLERTAQDIADRTGARVDLDIAHAGVASHEQETIVRIVREAVTNATRHGHATHISIQFSESEPWVLRVSDDGIGFDPTAVATQSSGFGLVSMRERAEALGAAFSIESEVGRGTTVEVAWC
jgi:signal transduction histidine kinase